MIDLFQLKAICRNAKTRTLESWVEPLNKAMEEFDVSTSKRQAAFLAQVAHESAEFRYVRELADGSAYEGRGDLGNTEPGDGPKYRGRGLLQVTGRANYAACGDALGLPLMDEPELLEQYEYAARSAGWFWKTHRLNEITDAGDEPSFRKATKVINGGVNGYTERTMYWERAKAALNII